MNKTNAPMTSHQLTAMLQYTRHANTLAAIRVVAIKNGFDVKAMESYAHTDSLNRNYKQYIVPPALCELVIRYSRDLHQRRAAKTPPQSTPLVHNVTPVLTMADEVVATLNRNPSEPLRLSRIAVQFECSQYDVAKALEPVVAAGRIKFKDGVYAAKTYKW